LDEAIDEAFKLAKFDGRFADIDAIAFTRGPGLSACLDVALKKVRILSEEHQLEVIGVNHMEGHALAVRFEDPTVSFPYLALLVSGGHSQILVVNGVGQYMLLGETLDTAMGEAFDKIARFLKICDLNGGKALETRASLGNPRAHTFPRSLIRHKNCDMSFSGLQTAVENKVASMTTSLTKSASSTELTSTDAVESSESSGVDALTEQQISDMAASFQHTAIEHVIQRLGNAMKWCQANKVTPQSLVVSGGVACNTTLFNALTERFSSDGFRVVRPSASLCRDNAIMIGWAAQEQVDHGDGSSIHLPESVRDLRYIPRWPLDQAKVDYFPDTHPAHSKSSVVVYREATLAKHLEDLEKVFSPQTVLRVCRLYLTTERYTEAHELIHKAIQMFPDDPYLQKMVVKVDARYTSWKNNYA
jgi:N6-L-threonylcarbamoyladenine synthase